ncbi:DUF6907 domain-containing protein [Streptomyces sp. NBC_01190]|uniref:DUF6907 domain-containing protein n=1 Tax=Streptomyces sp. NBC_01190 TaxID=2903767 RepID=UPI00386AABDC
MSPGAREQSFAGPGSRWLISTGSGREIRGYLPPWAERDPSADRVPDEVLAVRLEDVNHFYVTDGAMALGVRFYGGGSGDGDGGSPVVRDAVILWGSIDCDPYAGDPAVRVPVFNLHLTDESCMPGMSPEDLTAFAEVLRAHADYLRFDVAPKLRCPRGLGRPRRACRAYLPSRTGLTRLGPSAPRARGVRPALCGSLPGAAADALWLGAQFVAPLRGTRTQRPAEPCPDRRRWGYPQAKLWGRNCAGNPPPGEVRGRPPGADGAGPGKGSSRASSAAP